MISLLTFNGNPMMLPAAEQEIADRREPHVHPNTRHPSRSRANQTPVEAGRLPAAPRPARAGVSQVSVSDAQPARVRARFGAPVVEWRPYRRTPCRKHLSSNPNHAAKIWKGGASYGGRSSIRQQVVPRNSWEWLNDLGHPIETQSRRLPPSDCQSRRRSTAKPSACRNHLPVRQAPQEWSCRS